MDDPRRGFHVFRIVVTLTVVSLFYFYNLQPLYKHVGGSTMWSIMTTIVVFEYIEGKNE